MLTVKITCKFTLHCFEKIISSRDVFRTLSNIYDEVLVQISKLLNKIKKNLKTIPNLVSL